MTVNGWFYTGPKDPKLLVGTGGFKGPMVHADASAGSEEAFDYNNEFIAEHKLPIVSFV